MPESAPLRTPFPLVSMRSIRGKGPLSLITDDELLRDVPDPVA
jgi:hypothetical protein